MSKRIFNVRVPITKYEEVQLSVSQLQNIIWNHLTHAVKPGIARDYDSWYINDEGYIVGELDCRGRGSDISTNLGKADDELLKNYNSIVTVVRMLEEENK